MGRKKSKKSKLLPSIQITPVMSCTLEALDLHSPSPYNINNPEFLANKNTQEPQRRSSLCSSEELDLVSHLNLKSRSDTLLNDDGNANRTRIHNLNFTKTFASIDNKWDRAHIATKQKGVKKKLNLIQRKISMELMVNQLEKSIQPSDKKSSRSAHRNSVSPITSPTQVKKKVNEIKGQLKTIEADLLATAEKEEDAIKGIYANKTKEHNVIHLLEKTTGVQNKTTEKTDLTSPQLENNNRKIKPTSRLQAFSNAIDIRKNFKSIRRGNKNASNQGLTKEITDAKNSKKDLQNCNVKSSPTVEKKAKNYDNKSETSSSDEDCEMQMEISEKALYEIATFERLIADHMKRRQEYDSILYIDQDDLFDSQHY